MSRIQMFVVRHGQVIRFLGFGLAVLAISFGHAHTNADPVPWG